MTNLKHTPLFEIHKMLNARMINFSGWDLPLQYTSAIEEHKAVRNYAGIFDISHMGEIEIKGKDSSAFVQRITTNDITSLITGEAQYSLLCYNHGGIVDDILVYKISDCHYLFCVNAGNIEKDYEWIKNNLSGKVEVINSSSNYCQLAIQGKNAKIILNNIIIEDITNIKYYNFIVAHIDNLEVILSRTGYTGEDGFEIYFKPEYAEKVWTRVINEGKNYMIRPIGFAARDTLRLEMGYMLYGNDINQNTSPTEAGLGWIVKVNKGGFIGRDAILKQKENGISKKLVAFKLNERGIPRPHHSVLIGKEKIGEVTSGTFSPSLKVGIGMAYVDVNHSSIGEKISIKIRDKVTTASIVAKPLYKKESIREIYNQKTIGNKKI